MPLEISLFAPLRRISAFSADPVLTRDCLKPADNASAPMKIATVSPMPIAVVKVLIGRANTLRTL